MGKTPEFSLLPQALAFRFQLTIYCQACKPIFNKCFSRFSCCSIVAEDLAEAVVETFGNLVWKSAASTKLAQSIIIYIVIPVTFQTHPQ